jgi:hypothetical protein
MTDMLPNPVPVSVDDLMQFMTQLPNLPMAPDTAATAPADSPLDRRIRDVMEAHNFTREEAIAELKAFGF